MHVPTPKFPPNWRYSSVERPFASGLSPSRRGFTLIELLSVIGIMILMMSLIVPSISGILHGRSVEYASNKLADLANLAREASLANNSLTALIIATDPKMENRYRAVTLMQLLPTEDGMPPSSEAWTPISGWETLNTGVLIDPQALVCNDVTDPPSTPGTPTPFFPDLRYQDQPLDSYRYIVFLPGGGLLSGRSASLRITEGFFAADSSEVIHTRGGKIGGGTNHYDITILAATGRLKIDRP